MKKIIFLFVLFFGVLRVGHAQDVNAQWDAANTAYINGNYAEAIAQYEKILQEGRESERLYYNLGNACFKSNLMGQAILYYNKALKLAPMNEDVRYNLSIANTFIKDKINTVPVFFFKRWMQGLRALYSSNTWALLSIVFFALALGLAMFYLLSGKLILRKTGFYTALFSLALFVVSSVFAYSTRRVITHPDQAIVMSSAAPVKSSPDAGSKDIFVLHEGIKVRIVSEFNGWREITLSDGNKGWIQSTALALI